MGPGHPAPPEEPAAPGRLARYRFGESWNEGVTGSSAGNDHRRNMRKLIATFMASAILVFGGVACDDNNASDKIDEDDTNFGPGDGNDEVGPGR